jgi:uncharacterized membrane protein YagU involved in acid resistance
MKKMKTDLNHFAGLGLAAGLAGTAVMIALRSFDEKHAPKSIPKMSNDPAKAMVHTAERLTHELPKPVQKSAAMTLQTAYGTLFGLLYGLCRGRATDRSIRDGLALGSAVYAAGYLGWLPALRFTKPVWRQSFLEISGELWRHIAYGIATTSVYRLISQKHRSRVSR